MSRLDAELVALAALVDRAEQGSRVVLEAADLQRIHDLVSESRDCIHVLAGDVGQLSHKLCRIADAVDAIASRASDGFRLAGWQEMVPERFISLVAEPKAGVVVG